MGVNHKIYLSINGQSHENDANIIEKNLIKRGFEVVTQTAGSEWRASKIRDCRAMILLPSPYNYMDDKSMWIIGKGQWNELKIADEAGMYIYVKDIVTGYLYPFEDRYIISEDGKDYIKYAVVEADKADSITTDLLFLDLYDNEDYDVHNGMNVFKDRVNTEKKASSTYNTALLDSKVLKVSKVSKVFTGYPTAGTTVLGRPKRARFLDTQ